MPYLVIFKILWDYKFIILSAVLAGVCLYQQSVIGSERVSHFNEIQAIETSNLKQKHLLLNKVRDLEDNINLQLAKNSTIKKDKDDKVKELNTVIDDNSDRLQQLTQRAIEADERECTNTVTTEVIEKVIEVPTPRRSNELTAEMAKDFQQLSQQCASNYEELKNASIELEGWATTIEENIEIKTN